MNVIINWKKFNCTMPKVYLNGNAIDTLMVTTVPSFVSPV